MIPSAKDDDSPAVRNALESAEQAMQRQSSPEAMRLLREAAQVATSEGRRERAAEIFASVVEFSQREERHSIAPEHVPASQRARRSRPPRSGPPPAPTSLPNQPPLADSEVEIFDGGVDDQSFEAPTTKINAAARLPAHAKGTTEMPKTRLRRALIAIDPKYADRVDYDPQREQPAVPPLAARAAANTTPDIGYLDSHGQAAERPSVDWGESWLQQEFDATAKELQGERSSDLRDASTTEEAFASDGALPSFFVNLMHMPGAEQVNLMFVPPGTKPRAGIPAAYLVPLTSEDAERLNEIYRGCDAKLD